MKYLNRILVAAALMLPVLAGAQTQGEDASTLWDHVTTNIVMPLIELLSLAAFVVFVWGVVEFIRGADDAEQRATGQMHIMWGIVGLVIIFGASTLITILKNTFGLT
jgi:hypothetical protein